MAINPTDNSTIPIAFVESYGSAVNWIGIGSFLEVTPLGDPPLYSMILQQERQHAIKAFAMLIVITNCGFLT